MQIKRAEQRLATNVVAKLEAADEPSTSEIVRLADISEHGARVITNRYWGAGRRVIVSDSPLNYRSKAEVVYCAPYVSRQFVVGLKFMPPQRG